MKKAFVLMLAAMALVACNDDSDFGRDAESYTIEELKVLSEGFDATKIDHDQLLVDLTQGAIWAPLYIGTWEEETGEFNYNPVLGGGSSNVKWIFDADGEAVNVVTLYEDYIPRLTYMSYEATWRYEPETGKIVIVTNHNSKEFRLKVLYYQSPMLYFSQNDIYNYRLNSWFVNLRQYTKDQAEAAMKKLIVE